MKTERMTYESPVVEIVSMEVEKGFATSNPVGTETLPDLIPGDQW